MEADFVKAGISGSSTTLSYFHSNIAWRHVIVHSDCKALCHAFKSSTSQDHNPLAKAHLVGIVQWTHNIRHIEVKNNMMADFFVKSTHYRKKYVAESADPDLKAAIYEINIDELQMVSLQTLSPKALTHAQALCSQVQCHKNGNKPKSVKMGFHTIDCIKLFCEVSQNPWPKVPKDIRILIMQTFHGVGHPAEKEKARRISKFYYWPRLKKDVADFTASCQPCQATKPGNIRPQVGKFPVPERRFQDIHTLGHGWPPAQESRIPLLAHDPGSPHHEAIPMIEDTCKACCHCLDNGN